MALTTNQQTHIDSIIAHLLDFSSDPNELSQQITHLKEAIAPNAPENNDFYWLGKCIHDPCNQLRGLDQHGNAETEAATIGDAQYYIYRRIGEELRKARTTAKITINVTELLSPIKALATKNLITTFASLKHKLEDTENPLLALPALDNKIYDTRLYLKDIMVDGDSEEFNYAETFAFIDVTFDCNNEIKSKELQEVRQNFNYDHEQENYFKQLRIYAADKAKTVAAKMALSFLSDNGILTEDEVDEVDLDDSSFIELITSSYYFSALMERKIQLYELTGFNHAQLMNLTHLRLIHLLRENRVTIHDIKNLSTSERAVLTNQTYATLFRNYEISFDHILDVTSERSKFLNHPSIENLVKTGAISFTQALLLPKFLIDARTTEQKEQCEEDFLNSDINDPNRYQLIQPLDFFSTDLFQRYFKSHAFDWQVFSKITLQQCVLLFNSHFSSLITMNLLKMENITKITNDAIELIQAYPFIVDWIVADILDVDKLFDFTWKDYQSLLAMVYALRILQCNEGDSFEINHVIDTDDIIKNELDEIEAEDYDNACELKESIADQLLYMTKIEIQNNEKNLAKAHSNRPLRELHYQLLAQIDKPQKSSLDGLNRLMRAIRPLKLEIEKKSENKNISFFNPIASTFSNKKVKLRDKQTPYQLSRQQALDYCEKLIGLETYLITAPAVLNQFRRP